MVTAAMIAMFYLGTASGVMGAVLLSTSRSRAGTATEHGATQNGATEAGATERPTTEELARAA